MAQKNIRKAVSMIFGTQKKINYLHDRLNYLEESIRLVQQSQINENEILTHISEELAQIQNIVKADYDGVKYLTQALYKLRKNTLYHHAFIGEPLISIRIGTYNRANTLLKHAIPSIMNQTYQNFEVVIVGDHCTDDTEEKIKQLKDKRIHFYNLPNRPPYPRDRILKWRSIGTHPINMASGMAKGSWIAPIDDDDEFTPDHLEKLLAHAKATKSELVYGAMIQNNLVTKKQERIWSFPPEADNFAFQGAMYMTVLDEIFKYDFKSWVMNEVNDWNMCRRMLESGVKMSAIEDVVGKLNMIPPGHSRKDY